MTHFEGTPSVGASPAMRHRPSPVRTVVEAIYVLAVAGLATYGFVTGTTQAILGAGALALPMGLPALAGYYLVYGLLAFVPGADLSTSTGSTVCSADGTCVSSSSGGEALWFSTTMDVVGILALTLGALANVALLRLASRRVPAGRR